MYLSEDLQNRLVDQYLRIMNESATKSKMKSGTLDFRKLTNITTEEKRSAETDYHGQIIFEFVSLPGAGIDVNYRRMLCEVEEPRDTNGVIDRLKKIYRLKDWQFVEAGLNNKNIGIYASYDKKDANYKQTDLRNVNIMCPLINKNREIIINVMKQEGYYLTQERNIVDKDDPSDVKWILMCFAPNKMRSASVDVRKMKWLFHITDTKNISDIRKMGLWPKSSNGNFKYPARVYLWPEYSMEDICNYARGLYSDTNQKAMALMQIDVDKVPADIEFYYDPLMERAIFTDKIIPANAISIFGLIDAENARLMETDEANDAAMIIRDVLQPYVEKKKAQYIEREFLIITKDVETAKEIQEELSGNNIESSRIYKNEDELYMVVLPVISR